MRPTGVEGRMRNISDESAGLSHAATDGCHTTGASYHVLAM